MKQKVEPLQDRNVTSYRVLTSIYLLQVPIYSQAITPPQARTDSKQLQSTSNPPNITLAPTFQPHLSIPTPTPNVKYIETPR